MPAARNNCSFGEQDEGRNGGLGVGEGGGDLRVGQVWQTDWHQVPEVKWFAGVAMARQARRGGARERPPSSKL